MKEYHKIITLFERDPATNHKTVVDGKYATPEFEYLKNNIWTCTEKVDGTNIRVMWDGQKVSFGGKTDAAQLYVPLFERLQSLFYAGLMETLFQQSPVCLYGEGYGAKIQKGGGNYNSDGVDFVLFDVLVGDTWLERHNVDDIANKCSCKSVPIVYEGDLEDAADIVRKKGLKSQWGDFAAEGLVMRPKTELKDRMGRRIITKLKLKDYRRKS